MGLFKPDLFRAFFFGFGITAVAPASIATSSPSANGRNASDAIALPIVRGCFHPAA